MTNKRHIMLCPAPPSEGYGQFFKYDVQPDGIPFRATPPSGTIIDVLLPGIFGAVESGADFTFSGYRDPVADMGTPDNFTLFTQGVTRLVVPLRAGAADDRYGVLMFYDTNRPPLGESVFIGTPIGLRKIVADFFDMHTVEHLRRRRYSRFREELWIRHGNEWAAETIAPSVFPAPREAPSPRPISPETYHQLRAFAAAQAQGKEAPPSPESEKPLAVDVTCLFRHVEPSPDGRDDLNNLASQTPHPQPPIEPAHVMTREDITKAKEKKAKAKRATQGKVEADKFNAKAAKDFAQRRVKQLERQGKL